MSVSFVSFALGSDTAFQSIDVNDSLFVKWDVLCFFGSLVAACQISLLFKGAFFNFFLFASIFRNLSF